MEDSRLTFKADFNASDLVLLRQVPEDLLRRIEALRRSGGFGEGSVQLRSQVLRTRSVTGPFWTPPDQVLGVPFGRLPVTSREEGQSTFFGSVEEGRLNSPGGGVISRGFFQELLKVLSGLLGRGVRLRIVIRLPVSREHLCCGARRTSCPLCRLAPEPLGKKLVPRLLTSHRVQLPSSSAGGSPP